MFIYLVDKNNVRFMSVFISSWSRVETYRKIIVVEPQSSPNVSDEDDSGFSSQHELRQSFLSLSKITNSTQNSSAIDDIPPRRSNKSCKVNDNHHHHHHQLENIMKGVDFYSTAWSWFWNLDIPPSCERLHQRRDTLTIGNFLSGPTTKRTRNLDILFEKSNFNYTIPLLLQKSVNKIINIQNCCHSYY